MTSISTDDVLVCPDCGALVDRTATDKHDAHHAADAIGGSGVGAVEFLSAIDAEELEKAALNDVRLGGDMSLTRVMLQLLIEWADGRA